MGNTLACFAADKTEDPDGPAADSSVPVPVPRPSSPARRSSFFRRSFLSKEKDEGDPDEDSLVKEQAMAALMLLQQYQREGPAQYSRSASAVYHSQGKNKQVQGLPRSSTSRRKSFSNDHNHQHPPVDVAHNQVCLTDGLETDHFVLVHGGGFGAWCWYKMVALLRESGFRVEAVDLTGSGIQSTDTSSVKTMAQYVKPLVELLEKLGDGEKVILVGHDFGGACLSYVMELHPDKISKAVYVAAAMLRNGQSALDIFSQEEYQSLMMRQAQIFLYHDGNQKPPTAIDFEKSSLTDLLFHQCSLKDVTLALLSMRPVPFGPVMEKLSLSESKYGSVRRFYIVAREDRAIPSQLQEAMMKADAPEEVFFLKGADHSPFFSKPQALHRHLVDIARVPVKTTNQM
ncbi:hypothetical protein MLD38_037961 [Melastoma candidum]|uniref:Uncharacterized protein n=1 Tax=Melastoma candidum TaxID=119954 RepID=A0ACB9KY99_9MYRT|nr:hypothetical protein MLD38_037961 [Melastoma candidum]